MPQLDPIHYFSQLSFTLASLFFLTYVLGTYVLPNHLLVTVVRTYLSKL